MARRTGLPAVEVLDACESTNDEALRRARAGAPHGAPAVAAVGALVLGGASRLRVPYAARDDRASGDERVVSVPLFQSEVTNAFWKYVRAGVMRREEATRRLCVALSLVDEYADALDFAPEVLAESVRLGHPAYDVFYLVLARRCAGTLFSCDKKLVALCEENGVDCIRTESVPATVPRGLRATRG